MHSSSTVPQSASVGAATLEQTSRYYQLAALAPPVSRPVWASAVRMSVRLQPALHQHAMTPPAPPLLVSPVQLSARDRRGPSTTLSSVGTDHRRPMAAWVRRFRHDPPLPRQQRLPCTLDPGVGPAAASALQHQRELSADALLAEAQRVIASLGMHPAAYSASAGGSACRTRALAASMSPAASQRGVLPAPTLPTRPCVLAGSGQMAAAQQRRELGAGSVLAWDSAAISSSSGGATGGEHGSDGYDDDLLERWRRRRRAQQARPVLRGAVMTTHRSCHHE